MYKKLILFRFIGYIWFNIKLKKLKTNFHYKPVKLKSKGRAKIKHQSTLKEEDHISKGLNVEIAGTLIKNQGRFHLKINIWLSLCLNASNFASSS